MSAEQGLLSDICERPEDDTPRLVYADWLDDHDQPERAEFIRVQVERAKLGVVGPRVAELELRERELLAAHAPDWLEPLNLGLGEVGFERGFVVEGQLAPSAFVQP